jgi:hypothetical protein
VTPAQRVAVALAREFPGIDAGLLASRPPFRLAVRDVLRFMSEDAVVAEVVELGSLGGARSCYGVVITRLRDLPELVANRAQLADEVNEGNRWRRLDRAVCRGETLRALVDRGELFIDEAAGMVNREFIDADVRVVAMAALEGRRR